MEKISRRSITLWRIRLCIVAFVCAIATLLVITPFSIAWNVMTTAQATVFLFMYFLYYPAKYRRLTYSVDRNRIYVKSGVIYRYERYMEIDRVQYVNFVADPLQRIMGLNGVLILAAGAKIYIPCLEKEKAMHLLQRTGR